MTRVGGWVGQSSYKTATYKAPIQQRLAHCESERSETCRDLQNSRQARKRLFREGDDRIAKCADSGDAYFYHVAVG